VKVPPVATPCPSAGTSTSPPDHGQRSGRALRRALHHYGPVLALYGALKLIGFTAFMYLLQSAADYQAKPPRFGGGARPWDVLASWDGWWYQQIAAHGYHPALTPIPGATGPFTVVENSAAFLPLYPALMRLVSACTGLGLYGSGMLVSVIASGAAAAGIFAVTARFAGRQAGLAAAGLWAVWPGSGVEWSLYAESLYVACAVWACYAAMQRRWLTAALLTCAAGLTRPSATALIAALAAAALLALRRHRGDFRHALPPLAAMAVAPLGLAGYLGWVGYRTGDPAGYFKLEDGGWGHKLDFGRQTLQVLTSAPAGHFDYLYAYPYEDIIGIGAVLLAVILIPLLIRLRLPAVLVVYAVLTVALTLGSQQIFGNVSRYLLPAFPLLIPPAVAMGGLSPRLRFALLAIIAVASGSFAGYVLFELGVP
jgi:hypothetical protein